MQRIFDTIRTPSGVPLSDHYGIKMILTDYREECIWYDYFHEPLEGLDLPSVDKFPLHQQLVSICLPLTQPKVLPDRG